MTKKTGWGTVLFLFIGSFLFTLNSSAKTQGDSLSINPFLDWREIKTEHFYITYAANTAPLAASVARYAEEAYTKLSPALYWSPTFRTQLVLLDNTDLANGLSSPVLRFGIVLNLTPPDPTFSTNYYQNWLRLLIFHEYTHFLNMDATHDFYRPLRWLLGDLILPNSLWPTWMLEGLAVFDESKYTREGRGRSPYYDMIVRTNHLEKGFSDPNGPSLEKINGPYPQHPGGEAWYLYGYQLMNEIDKQRAGSAGEVSYHSSSRVPFFINGNLENVIDKDWYQVWDLFLSRTRTRTRMDLTQIRGQKITPAKELTPTQDEIHGVDGSRDGKYVAYIESTPHEWEKVKILNLATREVEAIDETLGATQTRWSPDGRYLIYNSVRRYHQYNLFSDLRIFDRRENKTSWLSHGARLREAAFSPNGQEIAFVHLQNGKTVLQKAYLRKNSSGGELFLANMETLFEGDTDSRIAQPQWESDGSGIYFTYKSQNAVGQAIAYFDLTTKVARTLLQDDHHNRFLQVAKKDLVLFTSDRSGVDNVYFLNKKTGDSRPLTNFETGVWSFAVLGNQSLVGAVYHRDGFHLESFPIHSLKKLSPISPPQAPTNVAATDKDIPMEHYAYSPWRSLLPRQWAPIFYSDSLETLAGGTVTGFDALHMHQYTLVGAYGFNTRQFDYLALYSNRQLGATLDLMASAETRNIFADSFDRKKKFGANLSFPFQWTFSTLTPSLGLEWERYYFYETREQGDERVDATALVPTQNATLNYTYTRQSNFAVSPEKGRSITGGVKRYYQDQIADFKLLYDHDEYFKLGQHVVVNPSLKAVYATQSLSSQSLALNRFRGRYDRIVNPLSSDLFDEVIIRGYPKLNLLSESLLQTSVNVRFPISQIFKGWGTNPLFFRQLYGVTFLENTAVSGSTSPQKNLPSGGVGLRLSSQVFLNLPVTLGADYQQGFVQSAGGRSDFFVFLLLSSPLSL